MVAQVLLGADLV